MKTYTGRIVNPLDLRPQDIDIVDIAHALSNICRFGGHVRSFYSVAEHSIWVAELVKRYAPHLELHALLHDASEAYLCDFPRPLKYLPEFEIYRVKEKVTQDAIQAHFGLPEGILPEVKDADNAMLVREGIDLMYEQFTAFGPPADIAIERPMDPEIAEYSFLARFREILYRRALVA